MTYTSGGTTEVTDYTYDANNRLTTEATSVNNDLNSAVRYYYDGNGNTTAEQTSTYSTTGSANSNMSMSGHSGGSTMKLYRYDEYNRLIQYNDDGANAEYTYSINNLRASKTVNGVKTTYVWNGQNLASETKNNTTTIYAYDPTGVISSKTGNEVTRFIKDPHGNVIATSKNNAIFGTYDYTAFGNQIENTDTTNPFRYCGEYYDEESGLTYLRNRYYNSATGRFISEDPIRDGANWYVYCSGNPIALVDPLGLAGSSTSTIPRDLDWDGDGRIDTKEDRARFDTNHNGVADWRENPDFDEEEGVPIWYKCRQAKLLNDFPFDPQGYDDYTCWAHSAVEAINFITGREMTGRQFAIDTMNYENSKNDGTFISNPNRSYTLHAASRVITAMGYLNSGGYEVEIIEKKNITFQYIKDKIDNDIPVLVSFRDGSMHDVAVMGYAYDKELNEECILYYDSRYNKKPYALSVSDIKAAYSFKKTR